MAVNKKCKENDLESHNGQKQHFKWIKFQTLFDLLQHFYKKFIRERRITQIDLRWEGVLMILCPQSFGFPKIPSLT